MQSAEDNIGLEINKFFQYILPENKENDILKVNIAIANKKKIDKNFLYKCIDRIMNMKNICEVTLTKQFSQEIAIILHQIYKKLKKSSNIKSFQQLIQEASTCGDKYNNITRKYIIESKDEKTGETIAKFQYKEYEEDKSYNLPIEMILLIRKFISIKNIKLTLNNKESIFKEKYSLDADDIQNNIFVLLNLEWLFSNLLAVEVDLSNDDLLSQQIEIYSFGLNELKEFSNKNFKILTFNSEKSKKFFYDPQQFSNFDVSNNNNEKNEKNKLSYIKLDKKIETTELALESFIKKNKKILKMIIIYGYFISKIPKARIIDFYIPTNLGQEILTMLHMNKIFLTNIHFLTFYNSDNIFHSNISFNSLDNESFEKVLCFIHRNASMMICRLSFFQSDEYYQTEMLYKLLQDSDKKYKSLKMKIDDNASKRFFIDMYDFKTNEDLNDYLLRKISYFFQINMKNLFCLMTMKNLINELSLIFDIPNIINKSAYFTTIILKFLLNIFILVDLSQNSIQTLTIVAKKLIFDNRKCKIINKLFDNLTSYNNKNNKISTLTFQFKFYGITNIYKIIPYNIIYLSLGAFDYETFDSFVDYITSSDFSTHSSLTQLQINLDNCVIDINKCYDNILSLLTEYPKNLNEINLYTFLDISYDKLEEIANKINFNFIEKVFIQFSKNSFKRDKKMLNEFGKTINDMVKIDSGDFVINEKNFKDLYLIRRNNNTVKLILNFMKNIGIKYNRNFMDYNIFLGIEKFMSNKDKKRYIISFK